MARSIRNFRSRLDSCFDAFSSREPVSTSLENALIQRLRDQANSKNRLPRLVQELHLPFGVFDELAGNVAHHVAANTRHFLPCGNAVGKFRAVIADAGMRAMSDTEEIERHDQIPMQ